MVTVIATTVRLAGLGAALLALVRETFALRAPGTLPIARLVRRELGASVRVGDVIVCLAAGVLLVAAPVTWSIALGDAELTTDPQWQRAAILAVAATVVVKLLWVFFEELAFRAALITVVARRLPVSVAIAISAIAFAAAHGRDVGAAAVLFVDGIGFGVAYVATRSLRPPIAWHLGKNLAVWVLTGQSTMQFAALPWRLSGATTSVAVDLAFAVLVVGVMSLLLLRRQVSRLDQTVLS
jgi:membrane protease YdiL (CAAX protease family)